MRALRRQHQSAAASRPPRIVWPPHRQVVSRAVKLLKPRGGIDTRRSSARYGIAPRSSRRHALLQPSTRQASPGQRTDVQLEASSARPKACRVANSLAATSSDAPGKSAHLHKARGKAKVARPCIRFRFHRRDERELLRHPGKPAPQPVANGDPYCNDNYCTDHAGRFGTLGPHPLIRLAAATLYDVGRGQLQRQPD